MTHSGGKPHAVGDRGQRYEVSFFNPTANERQVLGWTNDAEAARKMADGVDAHPAWEIPWVTDRIDAALRELCRLKVIKEAIEGGVATAEMCDDYNANKARAWARAMRLVDSTLTESARTE